MKGLLFKEFMNLKRYRRTLLIILTVFFFSAMMSKNISLFSEMVILLCAMMAITSFSYDEFAKWDKYALSMPVNRKEIVTSKYLFAAILIIIGSVIAFVVDVVFSVALHQDFLWQEKTLLYLALAGTGMLLISIMFPFIYKFGVEKARLIILGIAILPMALSFLFNQANIPMLSQESLQWLMYASPIILLIFISLSYQISKTIYYKKEF